VVRRPLEQFVECGHESTDYMTTCLDPAKFQRPLTTAEGEDCALVVPRDLDTLWFNTGTLCNLTRANCYI
jgi:hypothetical protein